MKEILKVKNLKTSFYTSNGEVQAVRGVDFELNEGEILGIVGESGSGKSVTVKSIMNIVKPPGKIKEGEIIFNNRNILTLKKEEIRKIKGNDIAMIFQDPMTSLNPVYTIGNQIYETIKVHSNLSKSEINKRVVSLLEIVKIPSAKERVKQYPHEFSGGMRQRAVIAMALANDPDILIADEPTTALDVTIQDQILKLLKELQIKENKSVILITHDLGVIAEMCQKVLVMYGGLIVEMASREDIFYNPSHPYTIGLLNSMPKIDSKERLEAIPGTPPSLLEPPKGCPFSARCKHSMNLCNDYLPEFYEVNEHQKARCWLLNDTVKKMKGQ
ncbi:MAG: ABC transporter ATP-binding protein [Bacillota bacterium]|nr:ABC transporter ATP-binding protein [Bacillota bacterium]